MRIKQKKISTKRIALIILVLAVALLSAAALTFAYLDNRQSATSTDKPDSVVKPDYISDSDATVEQIEAGSAIKQNSIDDNVSGTGNSAESVDGTITSANQSENAIVIRAVFPVVKSSGTCSLSMNGPDGKKFSDKVEIQALPSSTTCKGFNVPLSSLSQGVWAIAITFNASGTTGDATTEVEIK
ncbi:MAG: hypothetical protein V4678_01000 [Patescibacteria group bacterium]